MCFHLSVLFPNLSANTFPKDIPYGLPPIKGIKLPCQTELYIELISRRVKRSNNRWGSSWRKNEFRKEKFHTLYSLLEISYTNYMGIFSKIDLRSKHH
ncbi:hypothetical protein CR513_13033, partial [Mucuna pruriens]